MGRLLEGQILEDAERVMLTDVPEEVDDVQFHYIREALDAKTYRNRLPEPSLAALDRWVLHRTIFEGSFVYLLLTNAGWRDVMKKADSENSRLLQQWHIYIYNYVPTGVMRIEDWLEKGRD